MPTSSADFSPSCFQGAAAKGLKSVTSKYLNQMGTHISLYMMKRRRAEMFAQVGVFCSSYYSHKKSNKVVHLSKKLHITDLTQIESRVGCPCLRVKTQKYGEINKTSFQRIKE